MGPARPRRTNTERGEPYAAQVLIASGDAGSLATAAALSFAAREPAAVDLAVKASELDPENPSIGWLRLQLCANTPGCDIRDAATTMRWIDAENGAAWLPTLAAAQKDKDTIETDRILAGMAQGVRFDLYWNRTVVLLFDALKRAGGALPAKYLPSDLSRLSEAMGIASAEIIPPFAPLLSACRDPADAERRDSCLRLSKDHAARRHRHRADGGLRHGEAIVAARQQGGPNHRGASARAGIPGVDRPAIRRADAALAEERARPRARRANAGHAARRGRRHRHFAEA